MLAQGPQVVPVPGTKKEYWARENAGAVAVRLTPADLADLAGLRAAGGSWG